MPRVHLTPQQSIIFKACTALSVVDQHANNQHMHYMRLGGTPSKHLQASSRTSEHMKQKSRYPRLDADGYTCAGAWRSCIVRLYHRRFYVG